MARRVERASGSEIKGLAAGAFPAGTKFSGSSGTLPWPATVGVAFISATFDVFSWLTDGPSYRYALVIAAILIALAFDGAAYGRFRRTRRPVVLAALANVVWMVGIFVSAYSSDSWSPDTFILFAFLIPLALAPVAFITMPPAPVLRASLNRFSRGAVVLFSWVALADAVLTPAGQQANLSGHEKAFISVAVILFPTIRRVPAFKIAAAVALLVAFVKYPSATLAVVIVVAALSIWLLNAANRVMVFALSSGMVLAVTVAAAYFGDWLDSFYQAVDRGANTETRLALWDQALFRINESPWSGTAASAPVTGYANIRGEMVAVPFHNSFLSLAFCAGYVGLGLFVLLILTALVSIMMSSIAERKASLVWFPAVVAGLATMAANPVLEKLGSALPFYALLMCAFIPAFPRQSGAIDG